MDNYFELQIKINPEISDLVSEICFEEFDCEGVVLAEETYDDLDMTSTTEGVLKVFLRSISSDIVERVQEQRNLLKSRGLGDDELGSWDCLLETKENQDWSKKWKEKWDVTHVSERIVVVPDWIEYSSKADEVVIKLEPGCAFGTGTHHTTQLCMKACEKYMMPSSTVADIGMGSGILAICAKKLGAKSAYGCDNDETVIEVARDNAFKNDVKCDFELNTADKIVEKFDFILANILHNVLAEIMGDLKGLMNEKAIMVLSGILDEKKLVVLEAIEKYGLTLVEEMHQDQWVALVVKK
ncbi:MAG: 50S ribosomal protein L11 methyltransferase [Candidatus Gastranaerophilales bacterium]